MFIISLWLCVPTVVTCWCYCLSEDDTNALSAANYTMKSSSITGSSEGLMKSSESSQEEKQEPKDI